VRRIATTLLWLYALGGTGLIAAVRARLVAARPEDAYALAVLPLVAGALAIRERAWGLTIAALVALACAVPLHGLLTFVRTWRLE
jgi:hypothetical protein